MPRKPNKPFTKRNSKSKEDKKPFGSKPKRFNKSDDSTSEKPKREFGKSYRSDSDKKYFGDKPKRFNKSDDSTSEKPKREFGKSYRSDSDKKYFGDKPKRFNKSDDSTSEKPKREFGKSYRSDSDKKPFGDKPKRFNKSDDFTSEKPKREFGKSYRSDSDKKYFGDKPKRFNKSDDSTSEKPKREFNEEGRNFSDKKYFNKRSDKSENKDDIRPKRPFVEKNDFAKKKFGDFTKKKSSFNKQKKNDDGTIRLNKYIANAGVCSRREADELIKAGVVKVNGKVITELGTKIMLGDDVNYGGQKLSHEKNVYILLNKPKDYLCTAEDPFSRKTVLQLIQGACKERVYPVGRLDRNTTGLLLLTNDGDLTKRLTHPKHGAKKIYQVSTDKSVKPGDLETLLKGVELEDGPAHADNVSYVKDSKRDVGIEIHMGRNRVIRRMFETLGYKVIKLDRVYFAGLTKKDLQRGKWRFLTTEELNYLKMSVK
jgi:23S rRNA pseudouridine2605 synthase